MPAALSIRAATMAERAALEALQRRASDVWEAYREQLAAHPDAIVLPPAFIDSGWVRVAVADDQRPVGFSVVIPRGAAIHELDGLFVEPRQCITASDGCSSKMPSRARRATASRVSR